MATGKLPQAPNVRAAISRLDPYYSRDSMPIDWLARSDRNSDLLFWRNCGSFDLLRWKDALDSDDFFRPSDCSVALIAHIPPKGLPFPLNVFADDAISTQREEFADAYALNHYRSVHGLKFSATLSNRFGFLAGSPEGRLLAKANPTKVRWAPIRFGASFQVAWYPAARRLPPPPLNGNIEVIAAGTDMRALNGFFDNGFGKCISRACGSLGITRPEVPQIGTSIQIWLAADGCKCFAFAHNYFPKYSVYLDGHLLDWNSTLNFKAMTDYGDIGVEWQPFVAFLLCDALQPYALRDRYPGACGVGWYHQVNDNGEIEWCERRSPSYLLRFPDGEKLSESERIAWWRTLKAYVKRFIDLKKENRHDGETEATQWWSDDSQLNELWKGLRVTANRSKTQNDRAS